MKVKLLKNDCLASLLKYNWIVGKGCFTKTNSCKEDEIINPSTGRCVKRTGKIGKLLINPKIKSSCKEDEIINPSTGRCVKRTGKIGKLLINESIKPCKKIEFELNSKLYRPKFDCLSLLLKNIKYIFGPCTFFHFKLGERNIYLFGESHLSLTRSKITTDMTPTNTILFSSFVYSLATQNINKKYDVMFESIYFIDMKATELEKNNERKKIVLKTSSPSSDCLSKQFKNCIDPTTRKQNCPYKNLRLHYIDFRNTKIGRSTKDTSIVAFNKLITTMINDGKVGKQINSIKNKSIVAALKTFIGVKLNPINIYTSMTAQALVMDIYGLGRLLREFDKNVDKGNTSFRGTAENIIYYAGAIHINTMVEFFKDYLNLPLLNSIPYKRNVCESYINLDVNKIFV